MICCELGATVLSIFSQETLRSSFASRDRDCHQQPIATFPASSCVSTSPRAYALHEPCAVRAIPRKLPNHVLCRNNETAAWYVDESNAICLSILANLPTTPLPRTYRADFKIHCSWQVADRDFRLRQAAISAKSVPQGIDLRVSTSSRAPVSQRALVPA